jgi:hypothetical protein
MKTRYNVFEEFIRSLSVKILKFESAYDSVTSSKILEETKLRNNKRKIFQDAKSPAKTINNNEKTTELVFHCPLININFRVECKSQIKYSNIVTNVYDELDYVKVLNEDKLVLVLDGAYDHPYVRSKLERLIIEKNIIEKVWFGNAIEYEEFLLSYVN